MSKKNKNKNANKVSSKQISQAKPAGEVWDLEPILKGKSMDEWLKQVNSNVEKFKKYRSILNDSGDKITAGKLLEIIKLEEEIGMSLGRVEVYYALKFHANTKDSDALAKMGKLKQIATGVGNDLLFFNLWFMHLDDKIASKLIESKELAAYKYFLQDIRKAKKYTKTEEIEKIIHIKDITGRHAYAELYNIITNNYTFDWFGKTISKEQVLAFYRDPNPQFREKAYNMMLTRYRENSTTLNEIYKNIVMDWCNEGINIRGYTSSINIRNISYDVSDKAVDALLNTVRKNSKFFVEYFKIKYELNKKAGQKYPYSRYHIYAPLAVSSTKKYNYTESKELVLDTYKKFDERFYLKAKKFFDEKHIHSHPAPSKRGGAFCQSVTKELTPYLLLNHTDNIRDVYTMIHELGHGIHDLFAAEKQVDVLRHASTPICETASIFSEMVLADRMLKESKDVNEKKDILAQLLENQYATIHRQAYFVIFEKIAHEKIMAGATKEELDEEFYGLLKEQFGDMIIPEEYKSEWNYMPHIHETPFYCYAYAWGNLFVLALFDMYRKEGKKFIEKYIDLLSSGGNGSPIELMRKLGADPESEEFWQRGFNIIKEEVEELKKLK
ncbi:MAG TPA: M3 family oligoendopeptidase [Alphaproteobacteria bacterium]|nr:M3 family oligoendopeptidase [Alphaproteobacteria bacterium]